MDLKATIKRFRAWQKDPYTFKCSSTGNHTCANCGNVFEGDFCPVCGQKHDMGRVDWTSVDKELISIWSILDSKTLFSYLMQLFGRPGYLIGDYISGRRQVCSSPVSMLAIVAVIVVVILRIFGGEGADMAFTYAGNSAWIKGFVESIASNVEWVILFQTVILIIPTRLLFRFSPRHTRHTWPDGIFIQFFMSSLVLIFYMLRSLFGNVMLVLIPVYYCIAYRQLFGYGVWGTIWRTLLCFLIIFYFIGTAMFVSTRISGEFWAGHTTWEFLSMFGAYILIGVGVMALGYRIGKRTARVREEAEPL